MQPEVTEESKRAPSPSSKAPEQPSAASTSAKVETQPTDTAYREAVQPKEEPKDTKSTTSSASGSSEKAAIPPQGPSKTAPEHQDNQDEMKTPQAKALATTATPATPDHAQSTASPSEESETLKDDQIINASDITVSTLAALGLITSAQAAKLEKSPLPLPPAYLHPPSPSEPSLMSVTTSVLESGFPISGKVPKLRKFKTRPSFFDSPRNHYSLNDNLIGQSFAHLTFLPEVDIVYTWVNGSDPEFQKTMHYWRDLEVKNWKSGLWSQLQKALNLESPEMSKSVDQNSASGKHRFRDNDELRYSLRSVWRYAPWVRKVHIVTNGQVPRWLNTSHPRINVVSIDEIFPDPSMVPSFSSPAIEANIHRIPGLADKYLYLCDDFMFGSPVWPDDFWSPRVGNRIYLAWGAPECQPGCKSTWLGDGICDEVCRHPLCNHDMGDCGTADAPLPANPRGKGKIKAKRELLPLPKALEMGGFYRSLNPLRVPVSSGAKAAADPATGKKAPGRESPARSLPSAARTPQGKGSDKKQPQSPKNTDPTAVNMKLINELNLDKPDSSLATVCAAGCPIKWVGDGVCDSACNLADCGYDSGDCGTEILSNLHRVGVHAEQMDGYAVISNYRFPNTLPNSDKSSGGTVGDGLMLGPWTPPDPSETGLPVTNIMELPRATKSFVIDASQLFAQPTPSNPSNLRVQIVPNNLVQSATVNADDRLITVVLGDDDTSLPLLKHPIASKFDPKFLSSMFPRESQNRLVEGPKSSDKDITPLPLEELPNDLKILVERKKITRQEATAIVGTLLERQQTLSNDAQLLKLGQHTAFEVIIEGKLSAQGIRSARAQRSLMASNDRQQRMFDKEQRPPPEQSFAVRSKARPNLPALHNSHRIRLVFYRAPLQERSSSGPSSKPDYQELVKQALANKQSRTQLKAIRLDSKGALAWLGKLESADNVRVVSREPKYTPAEEKLIKEKKAKLLEKYVGQNMPTNNPTGTTIINPASFLEVDTQVETSISHLSQALPQENVLLSPSTALSLAMQHPTWLIDFDPKSCDRPLDAAVEREVFSSLYESLSPSERRLREIFRETVEVFGLFGTKFDCSSTMELIMQLSSKSPDIADANSYQSQALNDWKILHSHLGPYLTVTGAPAFVKKCRSLPQALIRDVLSGVYDSSAQHGNQDYESATSSADDYLIRGVIFESISSAVLGEYGVATDSSSDSEDRFIRPDSQDGEIWERARSQGALSALAAVKRRDLIEQRVMLAEALQRQLLREIHAEKRGKERSSPEVKLVASVTYPWELDLKNLSYPLNTPEPYDQSPLTSQSLSLNFDPLDPLTLTAFSDGVAPSHNGLSQPSSAPAGRRLLDMYSESLRFTSSLFNARFGHTSRKTAAHAPLLMDKHVVQEIVSTWPDQFEATSRHRFRHPLDLQYQFTYVYYVLSEPAPLDVPAFFQQMDLDGDGYLDMDEINYLAYALNKNARPKPGAREELVRALHESQTALEGRPQSNAQGASGTGQSRIDNAKLAKILVKATIPPPDQVSISLDAFVRTKIVVDALKTLNSGKKKYRATVEPNPDKDVCFIMLTEDFAAATRSLDNCRAKAPKFICINDDVKTESNKADRAREARRQFYQSYFPKPCPFELTKGENPYLHVQPLHEYLKNLTLKLNQ